MRKQELIDAAEASGLSRVPIAYVYYLSVTSILFVDFVKFGCPITFLSWFIFCP